MGRGRTQDLVKCSKLLLGQRGIHSPSTPRLHVSVFGPFCLVPRLRFCAEAQAVVNVVTPASARTSRLDCVAVVGQASRALSQGLQQACYAHGTSAWRLKLDGARVRQPDFRKHNLNYIKRRTLSITRNKYGL